MDCLNDDVKALIAAGYAEHVRDVALSLTMIEEDIERCESHLKPGAASTSERVDVSPRPDAIPDGVAELEGLLNEKNDRLIEYVRVNREFSNTLEQIETTAKIAFTYHYLHLKTWEEVCVKMNYSYQGMMTIRRRGLIQLYDVMPIEYRNVLPSAL